MVKLKVQKVVSDKEKNKKKWDRWYGKNRNKKIEYSKKYSKDTNYKHHKVEKQRIIRNIKRRTRYHFPLEGNNCKCGKNAEVRHHTTQPIEYDKFDFLCKSCHKDVHKKSKSCKREVI